MPTSARNHESCSILFQKSWSTTGLADGISRIGREALVREYRTLRQHAPRRSCKDKRYFVGHCGELRQPPPDKRRFEEHLAIALWRHGGWWARSLSGGIRLLDYQVPLQAGRKDKRIGKVDLLGVTDEGRLAVVELKVKPVKTEDRGHDPVTALMEGLRYSAIVECNRRAIARESHNRYSVEVADKPPIVQILAPKAWWCGWFKLKCRTRKRAGWWELELENLIEDIEQRLNVLVECVALDDILRTDILFGPDCTEPQIAHVPALYPVRLSERIIGPALPSHRPDG